jgi:virulence factor
MTQRIAVIGLGVIAQKAYLPILSVLEGVELLFCSRTQSTVESLQSQHRVARGTTDLHELLEWHPQAAFVLAPTGAHYSIASQLLAAGTDVFLEKPAASTSHETRLLSEQAEAAGRVLMVGFNRRYAPLHRLAHELWAGRPVNIAQFEKHRARGFHPDLTVHYTEEMIHIIDLLRFFCGEGKALATPFHQQDGQLVWAASSTVLERGGIASVQASMQAGHWMERYALHGSGVSLYVEAFSRVVFVSGEEQRVWEESYPSWRTTLEGRGFYDQIAHFFECVRTRQQPRTSGWEALKTQQLTESMIALGDSRSA